MVESFFSALKNERGLRTVYSTKTQARRDATNYIEGFYNTPTAPLGAELQAAERGALHPAGNGSVVCRTVNSLLVV